MNKIAKISAASITGVALAAAVVSPAYAWHPEGKITKQVQNVTANGALSDADTPATAVAAKPGDTLKYVVTVSNAGAQDKSGNNDMAKTALKDTLPAGVELVSKPSMREMSDDLGTIKPGEKKVVEYTVKVTATKDGIIKNEACFTGDSTVNDNPQGGCDSASIKVTIPPTPVTPVTPTTPATPVVVPETLPNTGPGQAIVLAAAAVVAGYAGFVLRLKYRSARQS